MQEMRVLSLVWQDPLEEEMTTHSSILAWRIPWVEEPGRPQSMGSQTVRHDWATNSLSTLLYIDGIVLYILSCNLDFFFSLISFFVLKILFLTWTWFSKFFTELVTILLLFYALVFWPVGMWDLSSPTKDRTCTPCTGRQRLNHWTAREVPLLLQLLP